MYLLDIYESYNVNHTLHYIMENIVNNKMNNYSILGAINKLDYYYSLVGKDIL